MTVLGISGSLQAGSSNSSLLRLAGTVAPQGVAVQIYESLADLPHFNPDLEAQGIGPVAVAELRAKVGAADAVIIATPEYAFGMPGSLKNALDWLVGSGDLYGKPVAILSAAADERRGANARRWTEQTLEGQGADVRRSATVVFDRQSGESRFDDRAERALRQMFADLGF